MSEMPASDQEEIPIVLADDVRSYGHFFETINKRASELGSMALTEIIKERLAKEFGLSTQSPIQLQLEQSQLSKACKFIKGYQVPLSIRNRFQQSQGD